MFVEVHLCMMGFFNNVCPPLFADRGLRIRLINAVKANMMNILEGRQICLMFESNCVPKDFPIVSTICCYKFHKKLIR